MTNSFDSKRVVWDSSSTTDTPLTKASRRRSAAGTRKNLSIEQEFEAYWKELVALESRLLVLYREARAVRDDRGKERFCKKLSASLKHLVGRRLGNEANPKLRTYWAFLVALRKISHALPDYKNPPAVSDASLRAIYLARVPK